MTATPSDNLAPPICCDGECNGNCDGDPVLQRAATIYRLRKEVADNPRMAHDPIALAREIHGLPNHKQCAEPPQRRAVELPKSMGHIVHTDYGPLYQEVRAEGSTLPSDEVCAISAAIAYAEQVAAAETSHLKAIADTWRAAAHQAVEERDEISRGLTVALKSLKTAAAERDAEKQRADALAVRVRELEGERAAILVRVEGVAEINEAHPLFLGSDTTDEELDEEGGDAAHVTHTAILLRAILADSEGKGDA